ncbi:unnamed protein product [Soboliphyme baturini]|uniref:Acyl-CoA_dh_N domain-containing protein n=1 Tax=Soboliphyme baturini TaxID=241478 RepID=A0A183JBA5_9BILA|nr:unnamed protein product [Soboliphyme baturini]
MALRVVGRSVLLPLARQLNPIRSVGLWRPSWWDHGFWPSDMFRNIDRELRRFEREIDRSFRDFGAPSLWHMQPFRYYEEPMIVEENGEHKMKMVFDVSRFK